ncbi:SubName: Full=Related to cyclin (C-terminal) {ECO:0000313/EMBL:CCA73806.1} [Serendipita indica DSM 11827]|nr:SubName: Full=Related to cyclin (C-terminal) {ECO:0000313/EMBL:CCA73806.1} [Serendipita indica DSM 11827]
MPSHALHSPNLSRAELCRYYRSPVRRRHPHSLVELTEHDPALVRYLAAPLEPALVVELIKAVRDMIKVPEQEVLPTPPSTPLKSLSKQQQEEEGVQDPNANSDYRAGWPPVLNPQWLPLEQHDVHQTSNHTCRYHRRVKVSQRPDAKNKHWAVHSRGLFATCEITLMEKQVLSIIDFDLSFTEEQLIQRMFPLLHPRSAGSSTKQPPTLNVPSQPLTPLTPIALSNAAKGTPVSESKIKEVVPRDFVLQPVPAFKKRGEKHQVARKTTTESSSMTFSTSQSAPSHLVNTAHDQATTASSTLALPEIRVAGVKGSTSMSLGRSFSSDGLLEGAGVVTMSVARTFSSTVSSSMTASSSISASTSTSNSEVSTPPDSSAAYDHVVKPPPMHRRDSDSAIHPTTSGQIFLSEHGGGSRLMSKILGVGKTLSSARRVGHGIKGDRKVSTATIVPDEVHIEH